jgi:hypothetical protein
MKITNKFPVLPIIIKIKYKQIIKNNNSLLAPNTQPSLISFKITIIINPIMTHQITLSLSPKIPFLSILKIIKKIHVVP